MDQRTQILNPKMSSEEAKIWEELEMDIEDDLEQEIKDGIYNLALRLHRLYQHRNQRQENNQEKRRKKMVSEVNISIKLLEGGPKIEIKQTPDQEKCKPRTARSSSYHNNTKRFDWERSLRSGSSDFMPNIRSNNSRGNVTSSAGPKKF